MPLTRRSFLQTLGAGVACASLAPLASAQRAKRPDKPNIIFILADDMGYGDLQCLNPKSKIPTPHTTTLAASGMRFTDAHSGSAVCTPTRYGVLTGRYAWRSRLKRGVLNGYSTHLIDPKRPTVASVLKSAGYATGGVGKWHLGMDFAKPDGKTIDYTKPIKNAPVVYGFDTFYAIPASLDFPPYVYVENDRVVEPPTASQKQQSFPAYLRSGPVGPNFSFIDSLDHLTKKATDFVTTRAKGDKPFFLYFPLTAPHKPVMPAKRFQGKSKRGPYGDFVMQVDWTIGQVVQAVEKAGCRDNTLIIVTSDNASFMHRLDKPDDVGHVADETKQAYKASSHTANFVFRGTKTDIYEGGHHVPYIASWPARIKPDTICNTTICLTDFMATAAAVARADVPKGAAPDSFDTLPLMLGGTWKTPRPPVVHHSANGTFAIRQGKWKLILSTGSGGREKPAGKPGSKPYRLYDMTADIAETTDQAAQFPEIVKRLAKRMDALKDAGTSK